MTRPLRAPERDRAERGSALVLVLLVILVLLGLGLMAMKQTRSSMRTSGNVRTSRQAYQVAHSGLVRAASIAQSVPSEFHKQAVQNQIEKGLSTPTLTFGQADDGTGGIFTMENPFGTDTSVSETGDSDRIGNLEFRVTMSNPRQGACPPGFQCAGGTTNQIMFYVYQFDVFGWVNRDDSGSGEGVIAGGGARKRLQADVRIGPISVN